MNAPPSRHPLEAMFNPSSVALVGASASAEKMGGRRWKTLVEGGFGGPLYPINPGAAEVRGHKAYKSIRDVPGPVELAVIAVAPEHVPGVVSDCAELGVRTVIIITAGFGEISDAGKQVEKELVATMRRAGGRLVGPNCSGIFSAPGKVNVGGWDVPAGPIGLISQSGNMALDFCQMARERGIGFSRYVTIGNAVDVGTEDLLDYLLWDAETQVVLAYIEGFGPNEGRRLYDLVRTHPGRKPVVLLKPGRSETGRNAALSHTGSLAGEDRVVAAALRECGVLRATEVEEAWELALALARGPAPANRAVAVLTDGGGHATLFCDTAGLLGLAAPAPGPAAGASLRALLPPRCPITNPIDFAGVAEGDPDAVPKALAICLADPHVGSAVMLGHFGGYHKIGGMGLLPREEAAAREMVRVAQASGKPLIVHSVHGAHKLAPLEVLREAGIPVCRSIEMPAKILNGLRVAAEDRERSRTPSQRLSPEGAAAAVEPFILDAAESSHGRWITEPEGREVLAAYGVRVPPSTTVDNATEAARAVEQLGTPAVLKLIAPEALHKTEIGGVVLNVAPREAKEVFERLTGLLPARAGTKHRVLVTPMIRGGTELVCGAFRDPQFGPVVMAGLGGIHVELLKDVSFRLAPLDRAEAGRMLMELKVARLFEGYRGAAPLARDAMAELLVRLSELISDRAEIREIDLNPVFLDEKRASIADVRIMLS
jgi:acetyltransferase